jgi:putative membrane protein insertion efficiency factor
MRFAVLALIRIYQKTLSHLSGNACRFYPTCSAYTAEAVNKYGVIKGLALGGKRLLRCHPFHEGGIDPVP